MSNSLLEALLSFSQRISQYVDLTLFRNGDAEPVPARARLRFPAWPSVVYALGDVHGCRSELETLLSRIIADADQIAGEKWVIGLGDYVDRGPDASGVIETLLNWKQDGFRSFWLAGNHDVLMYEATTTGRSFERWMALEGETTLRSYDLDPAAVAKLKAPMRKEVIRRHVPRRHQALLKSMPVSLELPGVVFVHAGIKPGLSIEEQHESDLLWLRPQATGHDTLGPLVVHGHTPGRVPFVSAKRICVDTGVFMSGLLCAVRLSQGKEPKFLFSGNPPVRSEWDHYGNPVAGK